MKPLSTVFSTSVLTCPSTVFCNSLLCIWSRCTSTNTRIIQSHFYLPVHPPTFTNHRANHILWFLIWIKLWFTIIVRIRLGSLRSGHTAKSSFSKCQSILRLEYSLAVCRTTLTGWSVISKELSLSFTGITQSRQIQVSSKIYRDLGEISRESL